MHNALIAGTCAAAGASQGFYLEKTLDLEVDYGITSGVRSFCFNDDGSKLFVYYSGDDFIEIPLSNNYEIDSGGVETDHLDALSVGGDINSMKFFNSGNNLLFSIPVSDLLARYDLSTGFDPSTLSGSAHSTLDVSAQTTSAEFVAWDSSGLEIIVGDDASKAFYRYSLSGSPLDLSLGSYSSDSYDCSSDFSLVRAGCLSADGMKLFVIGNTVSEVAIIQYNMAAYVTLSTMSIHTSVDVSSPFGSAAVQDMILKPDGTKIYIMAANRVIYQYNLPSPNTLG